MRIVIISLLLLTSCVSPKEREARMTIHEIIECNKLGFKEGTEAFANCRLQVRSIETTKNAARAASIDASNAAFQNQLQQNQYRPPVNCTTSGSYTSCY